MTRLPGREGPDRPLEGIGAFVWKVSLATVVALAAVAIVLLVRGGEGTSAPARPDGPPARFPAPVEPALTEAPTNAEGPVGRDIDRRHAAGELSEAQRKFASCRGGDLRRVAWIDAEQRVRKLVRLRGSGMVLEQWFDEEGRLREAAVRTTAAGRDWRRRVIVDERGGSTTVDTPPGIAPDEPPPALVKGDPSSAFFSDAGCGG